MTMYVRISGILCLLHDNRIFAFAKPRDDKSYLEEQTLILNLLTTARFRLMGFLYSGYHLADNTLFILIIVMSIVNNGLEIPSEQNMMLFAAIGVEAFYDILLYTHQYWILQRLSIYIGLVLYMAYFAIVFIISNSKYVNEIPVSIDLVWIVLGVRFAAFVMEEMVDIAIDIQLHNDLIMLSQEKNQFSTAEQFERLHIEYIGNPGIWEQNVGWKKIPDLIEHPQQCCGVFRRYLNVSNAVAIPRGVVYLGSVFAWGQTSVFDSNVWKRDRFSPIYIFCLCFLPGIPAFLLFIALCILCIFAGLLMFCICFILSFITGNCGAPFKCNYWRELIHI